MKKEEIKHFKSLLRQSSLRHMNILLNDKFQSELLDIIKDYERLIKENQKQQEIIDRTLAHLNIFISDEQLSKYDILKILMYAKKILEAKEA